MTIVLSVAAAAVGAVEGRLIERLSVGPSLLLVLVTAAIGIGLFVLVSPDPGDRWWVVFAWYGLGVVAGLVGSALHRRVRVPPDTAP